MGTPVPYAGGRSGVWGRGRAKRGEGSIEILTAVVCDHLHQVALKGFVLVGYPNSLGQAVALDELFRDLQTPLGGVLYLQLSEREVQRRVRRGDDDEDGIRGRLQSYQAMVEPVARHYARQDLLVTADAAGTVEETSRKALAALGV